ncbi:hypothetical protein N0V88_004397 [Collariella sp. IMI 366227]|nr:hypothetical protein N0V88_004397 [Collariella sp. IMI 366227]
MSGENGHAAPPAEGAPPAVETKDDATKTTTAADDSMDVEAPAAETKAAVAESKTEPAPAPAAAETKEESAQAPAKEHAAEQAEEKSDVEMTDAAAAPTEPDTQASEAAETAEPAAADADAADSTAAGADKFKGRRKSIGGGAAKAKKLNKKASKARVLHLDAAPGEHYFVKLKGFPAWPVIICDEDMLPASLLKSRPVTAKRADGTYREDFADGGKNVSERTFPVMYLHTNEFGWVPNTELIDLDPATVMEVKVDKMRKTLQEAHKLAAKNHPLSFYKEVLHSFQEELIEQSKAKAAKAAATPKGKKTKAASEEDEDVDMEDAPEVEKTPANKKAKKRKAEDSVERSDSVKKPKIKLTTSATPKATNGAAATPKSAKAETKAAKPKSKKKDADEKKADKEAVTPQEPELTPEIKHARKEKEVLFLRHKLQKGLLTRGQEPKEDEMKLMSNYITKLEGFPNLEVSIIRATKINKVLKEILKLDNIPKEEEFKFKPRSQVLLDKWNKLLAVDGTPAAEVNGAAKKANGVKEKSEVAEPVKAKEETKEAREETKQEPKEEEAKAEETPEAAEKPVEEVKAPEAVEASA